MAADYFLQITGVPGESTDAKHKDWIDVESWSWGETNSGSAHAGGGAGAGRVSINDFFFTTHVSKASPRLFLKATSPRNRAQLIKRAAPRHRVARTPRPCRQARMHPMLRSMGARARS